jgi:hypothetical protein
MAKDNDFLAVVLGIYFLESVTGTSARSSPLLTIYDTMQSDFEHALDDAPQYLQWT